MSYKKLYAHPKYKPVEISTDAEMTSILTDDNNLGKVYKFIGTTGTYINGDLYEAELNPLAKPLCFTANTAGSTIKLNKWGSPSWTGSYSIDGLNWNTYIPGTTDIITLTNIGDKVYFKGDITANFDSNNYQYFSMTGSIAASGNCNSMYISSGFESLTTLTYQYCYFGLFASCSSLTTAPILPATILSDGCYFYMFQRCSSLVTPPALPATTIAMDCYSFMFRYCTSLQVSDTQTESATNIWRIPTHNTFNDTYFQTGIFYDCAGTRSSYDMAGAAGQAYTYYTQNKPV